MFIRFTSLLPIAAIAAVALAVPNVLDARDGSSTTNSCNTSDQYCCDQLVSPDSTAATTVASEIGISLAGVSVPVGLTCDPITVIGLGTGSSCTQQPVCCTGNNYNGLIIIGCSPLDVTA